LKVVRRLSKRFVAGVSPDASGAFFCGGSKDR
jgi:hypothetical protein